MDISKLQYGDLLFFESKENQLNYGIPSLQGMYIGNNKYVHIHGMYGYIEEVEITNETVSTVRRLVKGDILESLKKVDYKIFKNNTLQDTAELVQYIYLQIKYNPGRIAYNQITIGDRIEI